MTSASVVGKRQIADDAVELTLLPDQYPTTVWTAGAHIAVDVEGAGKRPYSLCGRPADPHLVIAVRNTGGPVSSALNTRVDVGFRLDIGIPFNTFPLDDHDQYVFIAGGIGITPILAMVDRVEELGRPWRLVYTARSASRMAYRERFIDDPRAALFTDEEPDLRAMLSSVPTGTGVYVCGPAPMLATLRQLAAEWTSGAQLRLEAFTPTVNSADDSEAGGFRVRVGKAVRPLHVGPYDSVLDVLEAAGIDLPSSCRAGICGTCEVRVLSGTPDHRDDVLTDDERDQGLIMLPCVSRSLSEELVIEVPG